MVERRSPNQKEPLLHLSKLFLISEDRQEGHAMQPNYVIGLDYGTNSVRTLVRTPK